MRKEKKKCVSLFILKHDSQLFPALKLTSWGISLSCWELPVSPVFLCYPLPTQTLLLPSLLLMLVPPPRKRFNSTQIPLPSLGRELLLSPRVRSNVFTESSMSSGILGFISSLSGDVCLIDLSGETSVQLLNRCFSGACYMPDSGSGETSVQLLNEPAIFYLYTNMPYIKIPLFSASKYWVYRM